MKTASAALKTLLASVNAIHLVQADLFTFTLIDGTVAYYCGGDVAITLSGHTYALGPIFKRGKTSSRIGLQVDELEVEVYAKSTDTIDGVSWLSGFRSGLFDGARLLVERVISTDWTPASITTYGKFYQFNGRISKIDANRIGAKLTVQSDKALLNVNVPRNLFQGTCMHTLYDAGCTLSKAGNTSFGSAQGGSTSSQIVTALGAADGIYNLGVITFTSGALNGLQRTVRSFASSIASVVVPFPSAPAPGDTFSIYPGCNKLLTGDCLGKFANTVNFKAMPFVPVPETAA